MRQKKPYIFSNIFKFVLLLAFGILLTSVLLAYGLPKFIIVIIVLTVYVAVSIVWPLYIVYKAKSIRLIGGYINSNYKKPIFGYSYALAHGNRRDIEDSLKRVMNTYKQEDMYDTYGANLAIFQKSPNALLEHAKKISSPEYKEYYLGHVYLMRGNFDKATEQLSKLRTPWMIHSLKAFAALERGNRDEFKKEADQSIKSAIGMQRFVLHHTFRRFENGEFQ